MITVDDVRDFGNRWFDTVGNGGSAADQAAFFHDPHARIHVVWNGATFDFEGHHRLHTQWINERHQFGHFHLTPLNASPERARATSTVYWQAEFAGPPRPIRSRLSSARIGFSNGGPRAICCSSSI
jgi:hypothetical protein